MLLFLLSFYINYDLITCDVNATSTPGSKSPSPLRNNPIIVSYLPGQPIGAERSLYIGPNHFRLLSTEKDQNFYAGRFGSYALNPGAPSEDGVPYWGFQNGWSSTWGTYNFTKPIATTTTVTTFALNPQEPPRPSSRRPVPTYNDGSIFHTLTPDSWTVTRDPEWFKPYPYATTKDVGPSPVPTEFWPYPYATTKEVGPRPMPTVPGISAGYVSFGHSSTPRSTAPPKQRYLDLMVELKEGYLVVFVLEFLKLMYVKDEIDVKEVLVHAVTIYNRLWVTGRLAWAREAIRNAIWKISMILSGVKDMQTLRTYSFMIFHMLMQRRTELCANTNALIDEVDLLYDDQAGDRLFMALADFERYPVNTTKTGYFLCDNLMESVMSPFRSDSVTVRRLIYRVDTALQKKFPHLSNQSNTPTNEDNKKNKTSTTRKIKRNHQPKSMQDRIKRIQHGLYNIYNNKNSLYVRQYSIDYEKSMLRTKDNLKFRATTLESVRSTSKYISDLENRTFDFEREREESR